MLKKLPFIAMHCCCMRAQALGRANSGEILCFTFSYKLATSAESLSPSSIAQPFPSLRAVIEEIEAVLNPDDVSRAA